MLELLMNMSVFYTEVKVSSTGERPFHCRVSDVPVFLHGALNLVSAQTVHTLTNCQPFKFL